MILHAPSLPERLGRYEVGAKVGGGGMANVYVGRHTAADGREKVVALKVIRDEYGSDLRFLQMFSEEARILERIAHKHVIRTLEYGIEGAHRFIVMELLSGRTLSEAVDAISARRDRLSISLGAWICARIAEGLHAVHEMKDEIGHPLQIVHRDANPTNIFLVHDGDVKLIDFGLAKGRIRRHATSNGMLKGKIPYLAPESIQLKPVDRRVDIYALGTTLWELGTMKRLFKRETDRDTLAAVREGVIPDPRSIVPSYPDTLASIVMRALMKDPDERYQTAEELRADLDAFLGRDDARRRRELSTLLSELFPGEWSQHTTWLDDAVAVPIGSVPPPPMPIPVASSNMLDPDVEIGEAEMDQTELDQIEIDLLFT